MFILFNDDFIETVNDNGQFLSICIWSRCQKPLYTFHRTQKLTYKHSYHTYQCRADLHVIKAEYLSHHSNLLMAGRSGDGIPVEARFSAPFQTGPGAHPASYTMGNGSFPGLKRPGHGIDHSPHLAPSWKEE